MEIIYKKIIDTFKANPEVFTDAGLEAPRIIDINLGQPDNPEDFEIAYPAIYISWAIDAQQNMNDPHILTLDFHCIQEPGPGTENVSDTLTLGLVYLSWLKKVKYVLQKLRATNTSGLVYKGERQNLTPYYRYIILTFQCYIDDDNESLTDPKLTTETLEGYTATYNRKATIPDALNSIDTY